MLSCIHLCLSAPLPAALNSSCSFAEKAFRVQEAGALAAIIYDNDPHNDGHWIDMIVESLDYIVEIPTLFILGVDGYRLQMALGLNGMPIDMTIPVNASTVARHGKMMKFVGLVVLLALAVAVEGKHHCSCYLECCRSNDYYDCNTGWATLDNYTCNSQCTMSTCNKFADSLCSQIYSYSDDDINPITSTYVYESGCNDLDGLGAAIIAAIVIGCIFVFCAPIVICFCCGLACFAASRPRYVAANANPSDVDDNGTTPLYYAAQVDMEDEDGMVPVGLASANGHVACEKYILDALNRRRQGIKEAEYLAKRAPQKHNPTGRQTPDHHTKAEIQRQEQEVLKALDDLQLSAGQLSLEPVVAKPKSERRTALSPRPMVSQLNRM
ncbi:uncharacterized protein MONBRDRAFT_36257 [Monosiga brevicollis MX1]|uniref:PA domain-containing protein n=1 Tax=Monosiga brevicollis TaxID=81824 RepID=A9UU48_MONBE|nr:uncharacterized protein MONBRDRAFT_36257 [Monosiga brevicollis MX1]EDQ91359.1 predicted protein [Monosiga brevicollis MX1]|eukprot:XP_001743781.1 hypothetical protein [Monosiga brevicollis MX1]